MQNGTLKIDSYGFCNRVEIRENYSKKHTEDVGFTASTN
jgi:hypothetical protein